MTTTRIASFELEPFRGSEYDWQSQPPGQQASNPWELCAAKAKEMGFQSDRSWIKINMDFPTFEKVVRWLEELSEKKLLYPKYGTIHITPQESPERPFSWFEFGPKKQLYHLPSSGNTLEELTGRAQAVLPGIKVADGGPGVFLTDEVKELIEARGLTGADFLWIEDTGRYRAPQWFWLLPKASLGRGLDHPFFDISKRPVEVGCEYPAWRYGFADFKQAELKSPAPFESPILNAFVALFREPYSSLSFRTCPRHLKAYLPEGDWAFRREDTRAETCVSRRARDFFLQHGLATEDEFTPIEILDAAPPGVEVPDLLGPPKHPYSYSLDPGAFAEGVLALRAEGYQIELPDFTISSEKVLAQRTAGYQALLANPKPVRATSLAGALELLRKAQSEYPRYFPPGATDAEIDEVARVLPTGMPAAWRAVLKICNGFYGEWEVSPTDLLPKQYVKDAPGEDDEAKKLRYLSVAGDGSGDHCCLDVSTLTDEGDCEVIEVDHEINTIVRRWPNIGEFLEDTVVENIDEILEMEKAWAEEEAEG